MKRSLSLISTNPAINGLEIHDFTYTASRMGDAKLTATVMHPTCLDDEWIIQDYEIDDVLYLADYVEINGEKFFLRHVPSSSKSNDDVRYKHELIFDSEREVLKETYAIVTGKINAITSMSVNKQGLPSDYAELLNLLLKDNGLSYRIIYDENMLVDNEGGIANYDLAHERDKYESKLIELDSSTLWDALGQFKDVWDLDYFFHKKMSIYEDGEVVDVLTIFLGTPLNNPEETFEYGVGKSFLNISKSNSNEVIVRSITGKGSETNIPYYYPNPTPRGMLCADYFKFGDTNRRSTAYISDQLLFSKFLGERDYLMYRTTEEDVEAEIYSVNGTSQNHAEFVEIEHNCDLITIKARVTSNYNGTLTFQPTLWNYTRSDNPFQVGIIDTNAIQNNAKLPANNYIGVNISKSNNEGLGELDEVISRSFGSMYYSKQDSVFINPFYKDMLKTRNFLLIDRDVTGANGSNNQIYVYGNFWYPKNSYDYNTAWRHAKQLMGIVRKGSTELLCDVEYIFYNETLSQRKFGYVTNDNYSSQSRKDLSKELLTTPKLTVDRSSIIYEDNKFYVVTQCRIDLECWGYEQSNGLGRWSVLPLFVNHIEEISESSIPLSDREMIKNRPEEAHGKVIFSLLYNNKSNHFIRDVQINNDHILFHFDHVYSLWKPYPNRTNYVVDSNKVSFNAIADEEYEITLWAIALRETTTRWGFRIGALSAYFYGEGWYKNRYLKIDNLEKYGLYNWMLLPSHGDIIRPGELYYVQPASSLMPTIYRASGGFDRWYKAKRYVVEEMPVPDSEEPITLEANKVYRDNDGKYYLCVSFNAKPKHWDNNALGGKGGLIESTTEVEYKTLIELPYQTITVDGVEYVEFENEYRKNNPGQYINGEEDIFPTIYQTKVNNIPLGHVLEVAYDELDDDSKYEKDGSLEYKHPYFFVKLPPLGFNLFQHAIDDGNMTLEFQDGFCAGCKFEIGVSDKGYNVVQVDENNNLKRYSALEVSGNPDAITLEGDVKRSGSADGARNDTTSQEVWIALKKDIETFGVIMPSRDRDMLVRGKDEDTGYEGDEFVIVNISLPQNYVDEAEKRLDAKLIEKLHEKNSEQFTFSGNTSRIHNHLVGYEPTKVLNILNENSLINVRYARKEYVGDKALKVTSYTYNASESAALPEISITMSEAVRVYRNPFRFEDAQRRTSTRMVLNVINEKTTPKTTIRKASAPILVSAVDVPNDGTSGSGGGTNDHTQLINRDYANQHPIRAIEGLTERLSSIDSNITNLSSSIRTQRIYADKYNGLRNGFPIVHRAIPYTAKSGDVYYFGSMELYIQAESEESARERIRIVDDSSVPMEIQRVGERGAVRNLTDTTLTTYVLRMSKPRLHCTVSGRIVVVKPMREDYNSETRSPNYNIASGKVVCIKPEIVENAYVGSLDLLRAMKHGAVYSYRTGTKLENGRRVGGMWRRINPKTATIEKANKLIRRKIKIRIFAHNKRYCGVVFREQRLGTKV